MAKSAGDCAGTPRRVKATSNAAGFSRMVRISCMTGSWIVKTGLADPKAREKARGGQCAPSIGAARLAPVLGNVYSYFAKGQPARQQEVTMLFSPAYAQAAGAAGSTGTIIGGLMPLLLMLPIFYFLLIRPQQKKAKEHRAMMDALRRGDQVITQGGILGKVSKVNEDGTVEVEIAEGVKVKVLKHTITNVMNKTEPAAKA
jgi:preprotein translocase subunit YajC